jgi:hypothetical protein
MTLDKRVQILSSWCAASSEAAETVFPPLVMTVPSSKDAAWREMLETINAIRLVRMLTMVRSHGGPAPLDLAHLTFADGQVLWKNGLIGKICTYYKTAWPYEAQARVAYDVFFDRFAAFLGKQYKAIILQQSDFDLELFVSDEQVFDLREVWASFIKMVFSADELNKSFAPLVSTIKMTDKGFSALDVPIASLDQAIFLAAFYLVNLESLKRGDSKRRKEIDELKETLDFASDKELVRMGRRIAKLEDELEKRRARYGPLYQQVEAVGHEHPDWMARVRFIARSAFTPMAGVQIAKATAKIGKCISQLCDLARMDESQLYHFPVLVTASLIDDGVRAGGDTNRRVCYSCGKELGKREKAYQANKFIFESPSQRLQSGGSQTQPKVCGACAAISFVSPIKLGSGRLVVRMREKNDQDNYLVDEQLRMLVLGEMNIVAGKYAMLRAGEKVGMKLVSDKLGGLQYALYKVGASFEPEVFEHYEVEALIDNDLVTLPGRCLAWVHWLDTVFGLKRSEWADKAQFAALGRAIRHIQHEEVIFAIYELLTAGLVTLPPNAVRASQLEQLRTEHVRWLEMDHKTDRAQFFKDVAAMTGLLYPFCDYTRSEVRKAGGNERIEVRKVIERSGDPYQVDYTVAGTTRSEMATLYRRADMHFSYDQLKAFLAELEVDPAERESTNAKGQLSLRLYFDDVVKAYIYLFENRYKTTKGQRDFTYELKLSLYARFADLIESEKKGE